MYFFFFFKQKTAYEMRISDWSSDVCSSDLVPPIAISSTPTNAGNSPASVSQRIFDMGVVRNLRQVAADDAGVDIAFRADVHAGLAQRQKSIPARWFYDATGDRKSTRLNSSH